MRNISDEGLEPEAISTVENEISMINSLCDRQAWKREWKVTRTGGSQHEPTFTCELLIYPSSLCTKVASGTGTSKKFAMQACAKMASSLLSEEGGEPSPDSRYLPSFPDDIEEECALQYDRIRQELENRNGYMVPKNTVMACILVEMDGMRKPKVISLATGTTSNSQSITEVVASHGTVLLDCHAEVLAKRGFQRFILCEAKKAIDGSSEYLAWDKSRLCFRDNARFHLFVSLMPCGDANIFAEPKRDRFFRIRNQQGENSLWPIKCSQSDPNNANSKAGLFRSKRPGCQGLPSKRLHEITEAEQLFKMTCSDKIAMWNCVGIQGALAYQLLGHPIHLDSITIGSKQEDYCHGSLARAVSGRLQVDQVNYPSLFRSRWSDSLSLPSEGVPSVPGRNANAGTIVNWSVGEDPEVVDGSRGSQLHSLQPSRSSKARLGEAFIDVIKRAGQGIANRIGEGAAAGSVKSRTAYRKIKDMAVGYQVHKSKVLTSLAGHGSWIRNSEAACGLDDFDVD